VRQILNSAETAATLFPREHQKNRAQVSLVHFVCFAATGLR